MDWAPPGGSGSKADEHQGLLGEGLGHVAEAQHRLHPVQLVAPQLTIRHGAIS
jgi:hypothetical protein